MQIMMWFACSMVWSLKSRASCWHWDSKSSHITSLTFIRVILRQSWLSSGATLRNRRTWGADWLWELGAGCLPRWRPVWHQQGRGLRGTVAVCLHGDELVEVHLWQRHASGRHGSRRLSAARHQGDCCCCRRCCCPLWCDIFKRLKDERESLWWHGALCGFILRQRNHSVHCSCVNTSTESGSWYVAWGFHFIWHKCQKKTL